MARRQLAVAIRMFFDENDPKATYIVIAAAFAVVRNLCEKHGNVKSYIRFSDWIWPGAEKKFWAAVNAQASVLKHADLIKKSSKFRDYRGNDRNLIDES